MELLIAFRTRLQHSQNPESGFRDKVHMSGADGNDPHTMEGRKRLLKELLALQQQTELRLHCCLYSKSGRTRGPPMTATALPAS